MSLQSIPTSQDKFTAGGTAGSEDADYSIRTREPFDRDVIGLHDGSTPFESDRRDLQVIRMTKTTSTERKLARAGALLSACMVMGLGACTGVIGDTSGQHGGSTSTGSGTGSGGTGTGGPGSTGTGSTGPGGTGTGTTGTYSFSCLATTPQPGPSPMKLLTPDQYVNSVRDLLDDRNDHRIAELAIRLRV